MQVWPIVKAALTIMWILGLVVVAAFLFDLAQVPAPVDVTPTSQDETNG